MKRLSIMIGIVLMVCLTWSLCMAAGGRAPDKMQEDDAGRPIQDIAPLPSKDVVLTGLSQWITLTADIAWECYSPTGGIFRVTDTQSKVGSVAHTIPANQWFGDVVNHKSVPATGAAFLNMSGAKDSGVEKATCRRQ